MEGDGESKLKVEEVVNKAIVVLNLMWYLIFPYQKLAFNGACSHGQCPPIINRLVGIFKKKVLNLTKTVKFSILNWSLEIECPWIRLKRCETTMSK